MILSRIFIRPSLTLEDCQTASESVQFYFLSSKIQTNKNLHKLFCQSGTDGSVEDTHKSARRRTKYKKKKASPERTQIEQTHNRKP